MTVKYETKFGSLKSFVKGRVEPIADDVKHYVFSNCFDIAQKSKPYEKVVFGKWLFAPAFFWEDVFSMLVLALHTLYLVLLLGEYGTLEQRMLVALAGYGAYVINAGQFIWKLRMARLEGARSGTAVMA